MHQKTVPLAVLDTPDECNARTHGCHCGSPPQVHYVCAVCDAEGKVSITKKPAHVLQHLRVHAAGRKVLGKRPRVASEQDTAENAPQVVVETRHEGSPEPVHDPSEALPNQEIGENAPQPPQAVEDGEHDGAPEALHDAAMEVAGTGPADTTLDMDVQGACGRSIGVQTSQWNRNE